MVVDEVTMMDRYALEAADRSFRSLRNSTQPFGAMTMVFSGDWRQILTVVPHGSRSKIIARTLKSSYIWQHVEPFSLTINMRVKQSDCTDAEEQKIFSKYLFTPGVICAIRPNVRVRLLTIQRRLISDLFCHALHKDFGEVYA